MTSSPHLRIALLLTSFAATLSLAGCAPSPGSGPANGNSSTPAAAAISGSVHGGQQPVNGASIALYAAGKSALYAAPRSMLAPGVTTDSAGNFNITGKFTCQTGDLVYLVASGGDAGGGANNAIQLMTALGPCASLTASTFVSVNEVTTVASVYALANFMRGVNALGANTSIPAQANALAAAFANVNALVDTTSGSALQTSTGNGIVPFATINSAANSLAACVNSASGSNTCASLFSDTTVPGSVPADTTQAALSLAHFPATNAASVWALAGASPPFLPTLTAAPASYAITVAHPSDVLTFHNDISRDGVQSAESTLTPANVASATFGKRFSFPVDSYMFAQPLYAGGIGMPDGALHNLIFAATTRGSVYAFDADGNNPAAGSLWHVNLIPSGERFPTGSDYGCYNPPEAGIVGTPVIDRASQTLYVVVKSINSTSAYTHRLHAISLIDGSEQPNSPSVINPSFATSGPNAAGAVGNTIPFDGKTQNQRSALLLAPNGAGGQTVWIAYASHCDIAPYHGDLLGYNAANISQLTAAFNDTTNGSDGGIWMGSGGPAADASGIVYALAGNGTFDSDTGGADYGDSAMRLTPPTPGRASTTVTVTDSFTPSNQATLQGNDLDLGGAEAILFHDPASSVAPNVLIASDKNGSVYLINADNMGGYDIGSGGGNGDIQDFTAGGEFIYNFAFFNNVLYTSNPLESYVFTPGGQGTAGHLSTTASANTGIGNTAPVISANGTANAILWTQDGSGKVYAYTPALVKLYDSGQAANNRDAPATYIKFSSPVIANGKVFVGGQGALTVYGPLP